MKKVIIILDIITIAFLIFDWIYLSKKFDSLPEIVPDHFNIAGDADGSGNKGSLWDLLFSSTFVFGLFTVPSVIFYLRMIIKVDEPEKLLRLLFPITFLKSTIVILCSIVLVAVIKIANAEIASVGSWFFPLTVLLIVLFHVFFIVAIVKVVRAKKVE